MENTEFEHQSRAYANYINCFYPKIPWTSTIYKDLYSILEESLSLTKVSLGDYFFEQFLIKLNDNLKRIEQEVNSYAQTKNYDAIQKEFIFYHKPLLENRINELIQEYNSNKASIKEQPQQSNNQSQLNEMKSEIDLSNKNTFQQTVKWHGSQLQFTELIKPLIELKLISPTLSQKEIFNRLKTFFEIDDFNENDKLKDIRKRTNTPTPFLNDLETTLENWIKNKD